MSMSSRGLTPDLLVLESWIKSVSHLDYNTTGLIAQASVHQAAQQRQQLQQQQQQQQHPASLAPATQHTPLLRPCPAPVIHTQPSTRSNLSNPSNLPYQLQDSLDLLMSHYLGMMPKASGATFEQPKGASAFFVKVVCQPMSFVDLHEVTVIIRAGMPHVARLVVFLSFLLVPAWLWLIRACLRDLRDGAGHAAAAVFVAAFGLAIFLYSDTLVQQDTRLRRSVSQSVITASTLVLTPPRPVARGIVARTSPAAPAAAPASGAKPTQPQPQQPSSNIPQQPVVAKAPGTAPVKAAGNDWSAVRQAVLRLEYEVFGNELSEGALPADVLPGRVKMLCEQLNVPYPPGAPTPQALLEACTQVQLNLGVS